MEELRTLYKSLGFKNVKTYIQSGNVIFKTSILDTKVIIDMVKSKINQEFGYEITIVIRTQEEMDKIVENNPYSNKDLSKVHVIFLLDNQLDYSTQELLKAKTDQEEFKIIGKEIYLYLPSGSGRTKLTNNFFERKLDVKSTTRNWRTVNKILEIAQSVK